MSLALFASKISYLRSISFEAHFRDMMTFLASVMTGVRRWGILLYWVNSTLLGSIIINFRFSGELRKSRELIIACMVTDFPLPVAPAIRRWGILAMLAKIEAPDMLLPKATMRDFSESL